MKHPLQSKTLWANAVALVASVSLALGVDLGLDPATQAQAVAVIMAAVNIGLRFVTKDAISTGA